MTSVKNKQHQDELYHDVEKIKAALSEATSHAKHRASDLLSQSRENMKEKSDQLQENLSHYAGEKPIKALGIALLTGIVIGYFLHKK